MNTRRGKLRCLEGLGYVAALMIGLAGITQEESLRYFNILGLVFAIIVIVRLLAMNISIGLVDQLYEAVPPLEEPEGEKQEEGF